MFNWDKIPGNDNGRLREFLKQNFDIDWVKTANIEKFDDGETIRVSIGKNFLSLRLNDEKSKVYLKIDDGRTDEFNVSVEKGKLNVYDRRGAKFLNQSGKYLNELRFINQMDFDENKEKFIRLATSINLDDNDKRYIDLEKKLSKDFYKLNFRVKEKLEQSKNTLTTFLRDNKFLEDNYKFIFRAEEKLGQKSKIPLTTFLRANLNGANLSNSDLRNVDLREANLIGAKLIGANMRGANLTGAIR